MANKMDDEIVLKADGIGITDKSFVLIVNEPNASNPAAKEAISQLNEGGWIIDGKVDTVIESKGDKTNFDFTVKGDLELKNSARGSVYARGEFECKLIKDSDWNFSKITCTKK